MQSGYRLVISVALFAFFLAVSFALALYVATNGEARQIVEEFGYVGVLLLAIVSGFNIILPVPAATFTPVFLAAGLDITLIIVFLVIGTTVADIVGYLIGAFGRQLGKEKFPHWYDQLARLNKTRKALVLPFVFLWAAVVPLPNELILIPLALLGYQFRTLIIPLITGTIINQTILARGIDSVFSFFL